MGGRGGSSHRAHVDGGNRSSRIPKTLENHAAYEADWVNAHFAPFFTQAEMNDMRAQLRDLFDKHAFGMTINEQYLENVMQEGFKNQFQTHTSNGAFAPELRRGVSERLFGHNSSGFLPADYEKYGYLISKDILTAANYSSGYGDSLVMFKKENLIDRVTYTIEDSLSPAYEGLFIGGSVKDASLAGMFPPTDDAGARRMYETIMQYSTSVDDPADWGKAVARAATPYSSSYVELQFHGALTIADVDSIYFFAANPSPALEAALKARGIKVYK